MPPELQSDAQLLEAFRAGDTRAFEVLVVRYQRAVLGIARRFCDELPAVSEPLKRSVAIFAITIFMMPSPWPVHETPPASWSA